MRFAFAAVSLVALAPVCGAQQLSTTPTLDSASAAQVSRIVAEAQSRGLPAERIVAKVKRGLLIRTPSPRIVAAAQAVADRLEVARAALAPSPGPADILAGEDALSVGVRVDALKRLRAASPNQSIAVPLGLLTQLVASGESEKRATAMVTELVRRGATSSQLIALGNNVNADVGRGARVDESFDARIDGLTAVLAPGATGSATAAALPTTPSGTGPKRPNTP
ncbi:MAG: hypothetical protein ACHQWU_13800 [Gemmatimonadales bacterium]